MNPGSGQVDVESVAVHEFGHWLVLGHDSNPAAVMYAWFRLRPRSAAALSSSDVAGIQAIYGLGAVPGAITDLSMKVASADAKLSWTNPSANTSTQVLSSNSNPYFPPSTGLDRGIYPLPIATWNDTGVLVDTNASTVYYIVLGRLGIVTAAPSGRVGLFEFTLLRGN